MTQIRLMMALMIAAALAACTHETTANAGIQQLIQTRNGHRSVWGVEIVLHDCHFLPGINADQLHVIDDKYARDITNAMTWSVSPDQTRLTIQFQPGMGDFGWGNTVIIQIARAALLQYEQPNDPEWSISTDPT